MFDSLDISASALLAQRTRMDTIAGNIANVDTPGYRQKDLSLEHFNSMLQDRIDDRRRSGQASFDDIDMKSESPVAGILFHDRNNRSMEQLMADSAKNALLHNMVVELLRKQFSAMEMALRERVT